MLEPYEPDDQQVAMSGACWKDRFNEKQLERKRLSDRISQRRARQQSKRSVAELERWLELLSNGETPRLINRIQQENALLRTKIWRYRSLMEDMFIRGKDCLLQDDSSWEDINTTITTQLPVQLNMDKQMVLPPATSLSESPTTSDAAEQRCKEQMFRVQPSFFVELAHLIGHSSPSSDELDTNVILESIMMWKSKFGHISNEFIALLLSLNLDREPFYLTPEKVLEQAQFKHLFQDIIQNLLYGEELSPRHLQPEDKIPIEEMSKIQYQRRAVAYCAYETCRAWRGIFKSSLEYVAIFWAQYRYFMVIAFPTVENYFKCPAWRRPIPKQFGQDHPSIVDFVVWPKLRETLVSTWRQYDLPSLCVSIARSLEFRGDQIDAANSIKLQLDSSDIILEESFEQQIQDVQNFVPAPGHFTSQYPELATTIVVGNPLSPCLGAQQQEKGWLGSLECLDCPHLMPGLVSQDVAMQKSPQSSCDFQSDPTNGPESFKDTIPPDLRTETPKNGLISLEWCAEEIAGIDFQTLHNGLGEKWYPESPTSDFISILEMAEGGNRAHNLHAYFTCTDSISKAVGTNMGL